MLSKEIWIAGFSLLAISLTTVLVIILIPDSYQSTKQPCSLKEYTGGYVCVCNSTYCDSMDPVPTNIPSGEVKIFTSTEAGLRFHENSSNFQTAPNDLTAVIRINSEVRFQTIKGFGGAFTDAAGINIGSLPSEAQDRLMQSYFSDRGIEYNMGRIPMASCDFSTRGYTYNDFVDDFGMGNFSLAEEDYFYKIPLIKKAVSINSRKMSFYGSPWSAPAWMKTNNDLIGKGSLKGEAGGVYHHSWALYFARFIEAYENEGVEIWGITAQNEPSAGQIENFPFQCMGFTEEQQRDFIKFDLGPILQDRGHQDKKLMIMDDQRLNLPYWPSVVLADEDVYKYVSGIAIHWYTDFIVTSDNLNQTHELFPEKFMLGSEACAGYIPSAPNKGVLLGSWFRGERYSENIIEDITNWVSGWVDWNIALNMEGGPNWKTNFVDAPIIVNKETGEFYKQPMFYHIGHFSKFVREGSYRVESSARDLPPTLKQVAFVDPQDDMVTLVVLNRSDVEVDVKIQDETQGVIDDVLPAKSIKTYVWSNK